MIKRAMDTLHISDVEAAINHWRTRQPSNPPGAALAPAVAALAEVYALMVHFGHDETDVARLPAAAHRAWLDWYATTRDTPCIAICSTSQGDAVCKGCGRTEHEVQHWPAMSPYAKRVVWRRVTREGTAWRFNRYADRVQPAPHNAPHAAAPRPPGTSRTRRQETPPVA